MSSDLHISPVRARQPPWGSMRWLHPIKYLRWSRYIKRVGAAEHVLARIGATSDTKLTVYGMAALAVDAACYDGKRFQEIVGIGWDKLTLSKSDEWWHEPALKETAGGES